MSYEKFNRPPVAEVPFSASLSLRLLSSRQEVVPLSPRRASRIYPAWLRTPHRRPNNARFVSVRSAFYPGRVFFESLLPACRFPLFFLSFFFFFLSLFPRAWWPSSPPFSFFFFFWRHAVIDGILPSVVRFFIFNSCCAKQLQLYFPSYSFYYCCCCCCCFIYHNVDWEYNFTRAVERSLPTIFFLVIEF